MDVKDTSVDARDNPGPADPAQIPLPRPGPDRRRGRRVPPRPPRPRRADRHPVLRRRGPRHTRPRPRDAPRHQPARHHRPARRLHHRQDHRRRILSPHRDHRGGSDRLTTTPPPRPPRTPPATAGRGFSCPAVATLNDANMDILSVREHSHPNQKARPGPRHATHKIISVPAAECQNQM